MKEIMYCFDNSHIALFNDLQSTTSSLLSIYFTIPDDKCDYDVRQDVCIPNTEWNQYISSKFLSLYHN